MYKNIFIFNTYIISLIAVPQCAVRILQIIKKGCCLMETNTQKNWIEIRKNFMAAYNNDPVLSSMIPNIAAEIFHEEFGISISDTSFIPIVFTVGWQKILEFVGSQPTDEFAIDICGISLEYVTDYSESDKSANIVPQMIHKKNPIFTRQDHTEVIGAKHNEDLLNRYNSWRTVNLTETVDKVETEIFSTCLNDYGINLMRSAAILPMMAATYAAGLQLARSSKATVNMYNIFEIDIVEDDRVLLTPLATVKQYLKNDSKNK